LRIDRHTGKQAAALFSAMRGPVKGTDVTASPYLRTTSSTSPAARAAAKPADPATRSHLADYIVDVFFILLLAAPFVIFQSPATVHEAVSGHATATQAVVSSAAAAPVARPADAPAGNPAYGPE
jgi:hypothetical protein